jgi:hypothetical protein
MKYQCLDCSYKAAKRFPEGCCPACGSFNIRSAKTKTEHEEKPAFNGFRLFFLIILWVGLLYGIWDRYFSG